MSGPDAVKPVMLSDVTILAAQFSRDVEALAASVKPEERQDIRRMAVLLAMDPFMGESARSLLRRLWPSVAAD